MVSIFIYDREKDEAVNCGFAKDARLAILLVLPGINKSVFNEPSIREELIYIDETTNEIYINKFVEGKPVIFNGTLHGLKLEMSALGM